MCDKCNELDKKIAHYSKLSASITDQLTVERLLALIAEMEAQKIVFHPEQKK